MNDIRKKFLDDYISQTATGTDVVTLIKVADKNKPAVYKSFENNASVTVLDKQYLADRMAEIINTDFTSIAYMSSILVFVVLLITYGRIELALVSFIPMFITWIWILGIMSLFNIQFNIINIIISALIFGLGMITAFSSWMVCCRNIKPGRKIYHHLNHPSFFLQ
jgi:predicted RND superfamily exporter protein